MDKIMQTMTYIGSLMRAHTISNAIVVCSITSVESWESEANHILNMCVSNLSVYAVTSEMSKDERMRIFTNAFRASPDAPHLVITTYVSTSNLP